MILHVMTLNKFLPPFIDFVDENFGRRGHKYVFITSEKYEYGLTPEHGAEFLHTDDDIFITLHSYMKQARKIILHGLWRDKVDTLLYFNQALLKKCYWVMWGGDFYFPEKHNQIKKEIIKNMGYLVSYTKGDVELVRDWYEAGGINHRCFAYPSNLYSQLEHIPNHRSYIKILVGNSADPSNNHFEILHKLLEFKDENIKIITPLSYGNQEHAKKVVEEGKLIFGNKFDALTEFIDFQDYIKLLGEIDIAIFAHERQQAMGNIRTLLGLGKKVYLKQHVSSAIQFKEDGIKTFDLRNFSLDIDFKEKNMNINNIKNIYSKENLVSCWNEIFIS